MKFYQQLLYDKISNRRKFITRINLIINGLFILIILKGNLRIKKQNVFKLIEWIKKQMEIYGFIKSEKIFYWNLYFDIFI